MGGLKRLSGDEVIAIFRAAGFVIQAQRGSHVKLRKIVAGGAQTLTIPRHAELDRGALAAIVRQVKRFLPEPWLRDRFYDR